MKWTVAACLTVALAACSQPAQEPAEKTAAAEKPAADKPAEQAEEAPEPEPEEPTEKKELKPSEKPPIYAEAAISDSDFDAALARAKSENKNVLLMFGGNWCGWCHKLHELMEADAKIKSTLEGGYVHVMVDSHTNEDFVKKHDIELKGVPYLVVLDPEGKILVRQETGSLEEGPKHDPAKVLAFLEKHRPQA